MADPQTAIDGAARTAETVASQAASGNVWAFGVFVVLVAAALFALWIWRSTDKKTGGDSLTPPDGHCSPTERCPGIRDLSSQLDTLTREFEILTKQLEADRQERHDHRSYVEDVVRGVHGRIDTILLGLKMRTT